MSRLGWVLATERVDVKLAFAARVVHVADLAENGPLGPALVVDPDDGPHATCRSETRVTTRTPVGSDTRPAEQRRSGVTQVQLVPVFWCKMK